MDHMYNEHTNGIRNFLKGGPFGVVIAFSILFMMYILPTHLTYGHEAELQYLAGSAGFSNISRITEIDCFNGVDDDNDGLTDAEDIEDCQQ